MTARWLLLILLLVPDAGHAYTWNAEERLTTAGTESETGLNHGALALDSNGRLTAAWAEKNGPRGNFQIFTRTRETSGLWDAAELAVAYDTSYAGSLLGAKFPSLGFVPGDTLVMVWHDYRIAGINNLELYTKVRAPGAAWGDSSTEVRLTTTDHSESLGDNSYMPNLVVDPSGTAHVAWYDYRYDGDNAEILFKSRDGGAWDTTPGDGPDENVSMNAGDSHFPALAAGPDGTLHAAWRDNTPGTFAILYRSRAPGEGWSSPTTLSPAGVAADGVDLAVAPDGTVIACWADAREGAKAIFVRERSPSGTWGASHRVSPVAGAEEPAVAVDLAGNRILAWQDARLGSFSRRIFLQSIPAGGVWDSTGTSDVQVSLGESGKGSRPTLLLNGLSEVYVLWQDTRHGQPEMYFRSGQADPLGILDAGSPRLIAAWPNPFRSAVRLESLPEEVERVVVADVAGRRVGTARVSAGAAFWDGRDGRGVPVPAGTYFLLGTGRAQKEMRLGKIVRVR